MNYIFVEGNDDQMFVESLLKNKSQIQIIQYSGEKRDKIIGMTRTFESMNDKYVVLADLDGKDKEIRKVELLRKFENLTDENVYFSIQEIEAWFLAGVSKKCVRKYRIKERCLLNTENVTKEFFANMFESSRDTLQTIKKTILQDFDVEMAKSRNNSLKVFLENVI